MYEVQVYCKDPYGLVGCFMLKANSQLEATVEAAAKVRKEYENAYVGRITKV